MRYVIHYTQTANKCSFQREALMKKRSKTMIQRAKMMMKN